MNDRTEQEFVSTQVLQDFTTAAAAWIPELPDRVQVEDFLGNYSLASQIIPTNQTGLWLVQAAYRVKLAHQVASEGKVAKTDALLPADLLAICRDVREAVLIFLDGAAPEGISKFWIRKNSTRSQAATVISPSGIVENPNAKKRPKIAKIILDFGIANKQKMAIFADDLVVIPIAPGESAKLKFECTGKFKVGQAKRGEIEVAGSEVGLIFDGRGRPFTPPTPDILGKARLNRWLKSLGVKLK